MRAQIRRNAAARRDRGRRWCPVRDRLWSLLRPLLTPESRVAVVGAGNAHDLPLTRVAAHTRSVDLIDVDGVALRRAIRREPRSLRPRLRTVVEDVTGGAADAIVAAAVHYGIPIRELAPQDPLGDGGYDLIVADLLYTQLLFPALCDADLGREDRGVALARWGQPLTDSVVARLHRSAPAGDVVHLHDAAGWWDCRPQPLALEDVLGSRDVRTAMRRLVKPQGCDLDISLERAGAAVRSREHWRWPFEAGVDYLVMAVVAAGEPAVSRSIANAYS